MTRIGFLGPKGTFTESALLGETDLAQFERVPFQTMRDVLEATASGVVDLGFVAIENAIEGSVTASLDSLIFDVDLQIQREVVMEIHHYLVGRPGATLNDIDVVHSIPIASSQCRRFLFEQLPQVSFRASDSTASAAMHVKENDSHREAAIAPLSVVEEFGLAVLASEIEDHSQNATRFVLVGRDGIPPATGHDKTSIVCFQNHDHPGSLLAILQEFAARSINLVRLESRPIKRVLGEYCFVIDLEGHISDEVVADALVRLRSELLDVRFLGSYPAFGEAGHEVRAEVKERELAAKNWLLGLRAQIETSQTFGA